MPNYAEYFESNRSQPTWFIGDRVSGRWNKIPFIGTVGNENVINDTDGPRVSVFLDLPIQYKGTVHNIIIVGPADLTKLISY